MIRLGIGGLIEVRPATVPNSRVCNAGTALEGGSGEGTPKQAGRLDQPTRPLFIPELPTKTIRASRAAAQRRCSAALHD